MLQRLLALVAGVLLTVATRAQSPVPPEFLQNMAGPRLAGAVWADSVLATLTPDDRIAQLIMMAGYSNRSAAYEDSIVNAMRQYKLGGVVFFQGGPVRQARLTNRLQAVSKVPLLIAMDAEWGIAMRLDSTVRYPYQMTLGGMGAGSDTLIYQMGRQIARQFQRLGMHVNFAPDADVNNNPNNPVINFRAFGEDKFAVTRKALAYMRGMQDGKLLTSIKHFPGHGDTGVDSHYDLPVIPKTRAQLDSLELYPFQQLINAGAAGVMISHLSVPALDSTPNFPATLSKRIITDLLRNEMGFQGLIFSDAMNMQGLVKRYASGPADRMSIEAGMDVLEFTVDIPRAINEIKQAVAAGRITQESIDARCRKVLLAKAWVGLDNYQPIELKNLVADLNQPEADLLVRKMTEQSITVLKNDGGLLPLRSLDTLRIAAIGLEATGPTVFQQRVADYARVDNYAITSRSADTTVNRLIRSLDGYNVVVVGVMLNNIRPSARYGLQPRTAALLDRITSTGKAVAVVFGNAYALDKLPGLAKARAVVLPYQLTNTTEDLSAQLLFGAIGAGGRLPVTVNATYKRGAGIDVAPLGRLKYTIPEEAGVNSAYLEQQVDSVVNVGLTARAFPGCVVEMAKDGKVIFRKAYGRHTYDAMLGGDAQPTDRNDLFDLASITKITTSTPALMRLMDEGKFSVDARMADYLPDYRKSNKADLRWRDVLAHQAGLKAWIPFWRDAVDTSAASGWKRRTFRNERSGRYNVEVTDSLFLFKKYYKTLFRQIRDSPLNPPKGKPEYVYSDLSFYLYPQMVQRLTGQDFETYLKQTFYEPLGATTLTYNPRRFYPLSRIVPTEYDSLFRKTLIWGRVHDEGAAMLGGLSGHAGLFGSANDLLKLVEMYRQHGTYGGQQFIRPETLAEFTRYQFPELGSRRGLGFEKPALTYNGNAPRLASPLSYGHSGFTGTYTWVDPATATSYVFLSNRVYPTRNNNRISQLNIRTAVGDALYRAVKRGI